MERHLVYDVVVAGGGSAGVAAAAGAAQAGAKTLLIERNPYLGGQSTHSGVAAYCGFHSRGNPPVQVVAGVGERVLKELRALGEDTSYQVSPATGNASICFSPEILKFALDRLAETSGFDFLLHAVITGANVDNGRVTGIICHDDEGTFTVEAKSFVDATGDANLAFMAGCETHWGDENGVTQQASLSLRIDGIPADVSTLPAEMKDAVVAAKSAGIEPLPKEKGFMIRRGNYDFGHLTTPSVNVPSLDAKTMTEAEVCLRRQARAYYKALKEYMPGMEGVRLTTSGPQMGIRESRRISGEETITAQDVLSCKKVENSIARGGWSPEVHSADNKITYTYIKDGAYFHIPIGAIKPKDMINLWCAGRNISCDSVAHASVRVMGTGFATGHAAGVAAALTLDAPSYDYNAIRRELERQGALV